MAGEEDAVGRCQVGHATAVRIINQTGLGGVASENTVNKMRDQTRHVASFSG